jgi:uncharacterized protein (TIGR02145 family)
MIMKQFLKQKVVKIFLFAFLLLAAGTTNAQIGIGISQPAASAQLDVTSTTKGFLPPRMTQAQRQAIASPPAGLTIWCNDCGITGELQVYNGLSWTNMAGGNAAVKIPASVTIGTQEWMTRNLDVVTYRNGDSIPEEKDPAVWAASTTGKWCYYNNNAALGTVYGKLYNLAAVMDPRGLAPSGWRIPSAGEWRILIAALGGESLAGAKMKATVLWNSSSAAANNESGFYALPGGNRNSNGLCSEIGNAATWWTSTEEYLPYGVSAVDVFYLDNISGTPAIYPVDYSSTIPGPDPVYTYYINGFSVRCVR